MGIVRSRFSGVIAATAALGLTVACAGSADSDGSDYPNSPVRILSGFEPGGGIDLAINTLIEVLRDEDLVDVPLNIDHLPGGSGLVAAQDLAANHADSADILQLTSISSLAASLQNPGDFQLEDLTPVALLFQEYSTMYVRADSDLQTAQDVADRIAADPQSLVFAGGTLGSPSNLTIARFATAVGVSFDDIVYLPLSGGETELSLLGGNADVISGGLEAMEFVESGDFRALAVSSPEPLAAAPDVPTYVDQGFDVVQGSWRAVFGPPNMPDHAVEFWQDALGQAAASDAFAEASERYGWEVAFLAGEDFEAWLDEESESLREVLGDVGLLN